MYRIGIDIGGTNIVAGIVDCNYRILKISTTPTRVTESPYDLLDDIEQCIRDLLESAGISIADCAGIGIGAPGSCDTKHGIVRNAHNIGWHSVPVCELLYQRFNLPVFIGNDADCATLGEVVAGAARNYSSALLITLGTGVGGGLVIDKKIYSGYHNLGGEFGHMCIAMDGEECACGQRGCWEAYASATALIRQAAAAAAANPASLLNRCDRLDGITVYEAAAKGDATAKAVIEKYAAYVGVGLVNLVNALYPEIVLLGGGVSNAGDALIAPVTSYIKNHFFLNNPALLPTISAAHLGGNAGMIGASALVVSQW
ncbi:MAG: ROK family protein [Ruminococcaceae bacterium]|nr:ROK family protein [Oscillospiraceae bacterium]